MGIFGKGSSSSIDPNGNISNISARNRRTSTNTVSTSTIPVSIVPAPPQGGAFLKPTLPNGGNITSNSSVFGRQQSWSDQLADISILKGNSSKLNGHPHSSYPSANPVARSQNILYPNNNNGNTGAASNNNVSSNNDVKFVHSTMEILENQIKREEAPKKKRTRTSTEQLRILQKAFQTDPMPNSGARAALSKKLGMSTRAVQVWFQNRRAKEKLDAKRNILGLSGTSSFTYVKGENSDDEDGGSDLGIDEEDNINFDDDESVSAENSCTNSVGKNGGSDNLNLMKANGMMGRMAFTSSTGTAINEIPVKAQRSSSTPNGFFQGFTNPSISNHQVGGRFNQNSLGPKPAYTSHFNNLSSNNPLCHLFPGEAFISDVNEASVDQIYQDLGGAGSSSVHSPIDDTCAVNFFNQNPSSNSNSAISSSSSSNSALNFFNFGDPFYGGGIIDRTPSVSPVGFGPRSHFYQSIGNSNFDLMFTNPHNSTEFNSLDTFPPSICANNACKGISGGNVYLTSSLTYNSNNNNNNNTILAAAANRRSFSLPEAHGNLTFQQMQQLENFGLQVFPSPLLSINEEELIKNKNDDGEDVKNNFVISPVTVNPSNSASSDYLIPFSDFLEGEVIR